VLRCEQVQQRARLYASVGERCDKQLESNNNNNEGAA